MPGHVIWITGLSGAGKSVIAGEVVRQWRRRSPAVVLLDGDAFREVLGDNLGHDPKDRLKNATRISRCARWLSDQELNVVCATMSLFPEIHEWNRQSLPKYLEVYVKVDWEILKKRDPHGLYTSAVKKKNPQVVGIDLPFQEPSHPDLILKNNEPRKNFGDFARRILEALNE